MIRMTTDEYNALLKDKPKRSKYRNVKTTRTLENGKLLTFDSIKEANRFDELMLMLKVGEISDLRLQPEYMLISGYITCEGERVKALKYVGDFSYTNDGKRIVEDSKGYRTKEYQTKKNLMLANFGINVIEV